MAAGPSKSIAVVGGGITGLSAAWHLHRAGHRVTVFEKAPQVGGVMRTISQGGWQIERGPNTLQETPTVAALIAELGLTAERVVADRAAAKRYIVRRDQLVPVPTSPPAFLTSPLFSLGARFKILSETLTRPRVRTTDLSLANFFSAHFGREVTDYALNPFVSGVYAGDPEKLSARYAFPRLWQLERSHGSIIRGMKAGAAAKRARGESAGPPALISFRRGLHTLPNMLAAQLPPGAIELSATVTNIIPGSPWKIIWSRGEAVQTSEFDAVILALPASGLAALTFGTLGERPLASLDHQPHPPVSALFLGFKRDQVAHPLDGFGMLIPARERRNLLGALFNSTLFHGRAPAGHVALTIFAGGANRPEIARLETRELIERILPDLRALLGVHGEPVFSQHVFWPRAIPQYNLGHERFLEPMARCEDSYPGLFIGGNPRDGISVPDCLKSGSELARKTGEFLR
jgi:oxygen-dependent protoporphyrinogen oxidase